MECTHNPNKQRSPYLSNTRARTLAHKIAKDREERRGRIDRRERDRSRK